MSSSRRTSGEVNILAMLDGLGSRPRERRTRLRYGVGGLLSCVLVGTLAWMVHEPAPDAGQSTVALELPAPVAANAGKPAQFAAAPAPLAIQAPAGPDPAQAALPAPASSGGATIVNLPAVSGADAGPAPVLEQAVPAPSHTAAHTAAHAAAHVAAPKTASARQPTARTSVADVRPAAHRAPKRLAAAGRSANAPAVVDTDVALITAIMQHAAIGHTDERACGDKPCVPRPPERP